MLDGDSPPSRSMRHTRLFRAAPIGADVTTSRPNAARQISPRSGAAVEEVITQSPPAGDHPGAIRRHRRRLRRVENLLDIRGKRRLEEHFLEIINEMRTADT